MPMMVQPCAAYQRDSARVEKRGPSMITSVPSGARSSHPAALAAETATDRPTGQYGSANWTWTAPPSS